MSKTIDESTLIEVDGWRGKFLLGPNHTYWWKDKKTSTPRPLSGITSVLGVIAKPMLIQWAANMAVDYILKESDGNTLHRTVLVSTLEEARKAHTVKKDNAAGLGHDAHALVEEYVKERILNSAGIPIIPNLGKEPRVIEFAQWAVERHQETGFRFIASETPLADGKLALAGTPDFIGEEIVDGKHRIVIGDLKTGSGVYDRAFFAQMAAYGYMWSKKNRSKLPVALVVVHMPAQKPNQPVAIYWSEDWKGDWEGFKAALYLHRWKDNFVKPKWKKP